LPRTGDAAAYPCLTVVKNLVNVVIILALAALVDLVPQGGRGASVAGQAVWLVFLATLVWFAVTMYRQHRVSLYSLGDRRRGILYAAVAVVALTLTATSRLWDTGAGSVAWLVLLAGAAYAIIAIVWSARRY
jgi:hypothetical protein